MKVKERPYTTKIHEYELHEADAEDWMRYEALMEEKDWNLASQGLDVEGKVKVFYEILENGVSKVFKEKNEFSEEKLKAKDQRTRSQRK